VIRKLSHPKCKMKRTANSNEAGFTLLETSIAMVLLAIAGLGVAACFFYAARNNSSARDRELSMAVAQQTMEQFRNASFADAALNATGEVSSTITRAGRRYAVLTTITDTNVQDGTARTKTIQIRVSPLSDSERWARDITGVFGSVTIISQRTAPTVGPNRAL
jgi:prepilin-type N-terminal cleavage/methylation domain-containing protein